MVELLPFRGIFSHQEVELNHSPLNMGFPGGSDGEESVCNVGDLGSVSGLGRFPGGVHGNPL